MTPKRTTKKPSRNITYTPPEDTSPQDRLHYFLMNYVNLPSFLSNGQLNRTKFLPFVASPHPPSRRTLEAPDGIGYAILLSDLQILSKMRERSLIDCGAADIEVGKVQGGDVAEGEKHEVYITTVVTKDPEEWKISMLAQLNNAEHRVLRAAGPPPANINADPRADELKASLEFVFKGPGFRMNEELAVFEKILTWERCVELLKYQARVEEFGSRAESTSPLRHMGVYGNGFDMCEMRRVIANGGPKYIDESGEDVEMEQEEHRAAEGEGALGDDGMAREEGVVGKEGVVQEGGVDEEEPMVREEGAVEEGGEEGPGEVDENDDGLAFSGDEKGDGDFNPRKSSSSKKPSTTKKTIGGLGAGQKRAPGRPRKSHAPPPEATSSKVAKPKPPATPNSDDEDEDEDEDEDQDHDSEDEDQEELAGSTTNAPRKINPERLAAKIMEAVRRGEYIHEDRPTKD